MWSLGSFWKVNLDFDLKRGAIIAPFFCYREYYERLRFLCWICAPEDENFADQEDQA